MRVSPELRRVTTRPGTAEASAKAWTDEGRRDHRGQQPEPDPCTLSRRRPPRLTTPARRDSMAATSRAARVDSRRVGRSGMSSTGKFISLIVLSAQVAWLFVVGALAAPAA